MMKILFIIVLLGIIYKINKFISGIGITNSNNEKNKTTDPKFKMDIEDAEYEEIE